MSLHYEVWKWHGQGRERENCGNNMQLSYSFPIATSVWWIKMNIISIKNWEWGRKKLGIIAQMKKYRETVMTETIPVTISGHL